MEQVIEKVLVKLNKRNKSLLLLFLLLLLLLLLLLDIEDGCQQVIQLNLPCTLLVIAS